MRLNIFNKYIRVLIVSDFLMVGSFGLLTPIFAIFVTNQIEGGGLTVAGFSEMIFLLVKSLIQIPVSEFLDRQRKKKGAFIDVVLIILGSLLIAGVHFSFIWVHTIWQLYLVQAIYAVGVTLIYPTWMVLFTRNVNPARESLHWGVYNTVTGVGGAIAAAVGGILAENVGFKAVFIVMGLASLLGTAFLLLIYKDVRIMARRKRNKN